MAQSCAALRHSATAKLRKLIYDQRITDRRGTIVRNMQEYDMGELKEVQLIQMNSKLAGLSLE